MQEEYHIKTAPNFVITKRNNESFENLMSRFKRKTKSSKVLVKSVEKMFFIRPAEKQRQKRLRNKYFKQFENQQQFVYLLLTIKLLY